MVIQDKEGLIWEASQAQISPVQPLGHTTMGGQLLGYLLYRGQLDVSHINAYPRHHQKPSHQVCIFCSGLHTG